MKVEQQTCGCVCHDSVYLMDVATYTVKHQLPQTRVADMKFSPKGTVLATWGAYYSKSLPNIFFFFFFFYFFFRLCLVLLLFFFFFSSSFSFFYSIFFVFFFFFLFFFFFFFFLSFFYFFFSSSSSSFLLLFSSSSSSSSSSFLLRLLCAKLDHWGSPFFGEIFCVCYHFYPVMHEVASSTKAHAWCVFVATIHLS